SNSCTEPAAGRDLDFLAFDEQAEYAQGHAGRQRCSGAVLAGGAEGRAQLDLSLRSVDIARRKNQFASLAAATGLLRMHDLPDSRHAGGNEHDVTGLDVRGDAQFEEVVALIVSGADGIDHFQFDDG